MPVKLQFRHGSHPSMLFEVCGPPDRKGCACGVICQADRFLANAAAGSLDSLALHSSRRILSAKSPKADIQ
jgi:hypothetical protein